MAYFTEESKDKEKSTEEPKQEEMPLSGSQEEESEKKTNYIILQTSTTSKHKNKIKTTLWFTHIGPKFGIKWLILWLSSFLADNIVTASKNSFPFKFNNLIITGHGINFEQFFNTKEKFELKNFLILSRISKSKNIENTIENFKKITNFEKCKLDIIGGTLNSNDEEYLEYLKTKYFQYKNST